MGAPMVSRDIIRISSEKMVTKQDLLVEEMAFTIDVNQEEFVSLLCSPTHLEDLALGFLFTEGLIKGIEDILEMQLIEERNRVEVELMSSHKVLQRLKGKRLLTSGCGKGLTLTSLDFVSIRPIRSEICFSFQMLIGAMANLQQHTEIFSKTGGTHSAALFHQDKLIILAEDIGRHNAVDKVVGWAVRNRIDLEDKYIVCSGRISSEMITKVIKAGLPLVASRSAPTASAVALADKANISLVGFLRGKKGNIYCHGERVNVE